MAFSYLLYSAQRWIVDTGITLAMLIVIALLVPRTARFLLRFFTARYEKATGTSGEKHKASLTLMGTVLYLLQGVAYFLLIIEFFRQLGFTLAVAAVPATVVSAALGFGAQSIIADLLAGFFIITEKQFGVGDNVQFGSTTSGIQGDVVRITMRSTRLRTQGGQLVTVPNSQTTLSINYSNRWARAVVNAPLPLRSQYTLMEMINRAREAGERAIAEPSIKEFILGPMDIQPATDIVHTTGLDTPWVMSTRFVVDVKPGKQWAVERVIRTALIAEFWSDYASAECPTELLHLPDAPDTHSDTYDNSVAEMTTESSTHTADSQQNPVGLLQPSYSTTEEEAEEDDTEDNDTVWGKILGIRSTPRRSTIILCVLLLVLIIVRVVTVQPSEDWNGNTWIYNPRNTTQQLTQTDTDTTPTSQSISSSAPSTTPPTQVSVSPAPTSIMENPPAESSSVSDEAFQDDTSTRDRKENETRDAQEEDPTDHAQPATRTEESNDHSSPLEPSAAQSAPDDTKRATGTEPSAVSGPVDTPTGAGA